MSSNELTALYASVHKAETNEAKAEALNNLGNKLIEQSQYNDAIDVANQAKTLACESGCILQEGRAFNILGNASIDQGNYTGALEFFHQAISLFESLNDCSRIAIVTGNIGLVYRNLSDYSKALEFYQKALAIDEKLCNKASMARHIGNIGNVYLILSDHQRALEYYQKALLLSEELGDPSGIAKHTGNIGSIYLHISNYTQALVYFNSAFTIHEKLEEKLDMAIITGNIGGAYFGIPDYKKSVEYYTKALNIYEELGNKSGIADMTGYLGLVNQMLDDNLTAMKYYYTSLLMNEELGNKRGIAFNTNKIGALYGEKKFKGYNASKAEKYLLEAVELNKELGTKEYLYRNYETLSEFYDQMGDGSNAYKYHKLYHALEKEVQSEEAKKQAEQLDYERKTAEKAKQTAIDRAKHEATEQLLHNVLPPSIAAKMLSGETLIAEKLDNVSVLFADIVNFTRLSQRISPEELVQGLDMVFSAFDVLAEKHGLEKIKTIGDSYMVVSGAPVPREDHAQAIAAMAIEMVESVRAFSSLAVGTSIEIRVGIHTGEVVAGVIGKKKFAYDMWGDAVNTASRMESHSEPGKIHITDEFAKALNTLDSDSLPLMADLKIVERGEIEIKGKGRMRTYFLEKAI